MTTGRIDEKGRILIPLELRQKLGLESGSEIVFMVSGKNIILRSALNSEEFRKLSKKITQEIQNSTNEPIEIEKLF
ncbi:MAG: AbrB/MazE/SpoVT family DNA-binding domain-containing protein [Candidatus Thorarchaeota archaeon]